MLFEFYICTCSVVVYKELKYMTCKLFAFVQTIVACDFTPNSDDNCDYFIIGYCINFVVNWHINML